MNQSTSTPHLTQQLSSLSDSLKQTNGLITRLSKLSFQPGSEPLSDSTNVRLELAQDIHASLAQLEEDLDLLTTEADDLNAPAPAHYPGSSFTSGSGYGSTARRSSSLRDNDRTRTSALLTRLTEDLRSSRRHFRRAQLTAKRASEAAKQTERELVFASLHNPPTPPSTTNGGATTPDLFANRRLATKQKQLTTSELEVDASTTVTAALRRTHALLTTELSRSRFAQETFDESTAALRELGEPYSNLDTILSASRNLLGTLLRSQKSDTWYLETAFYILIATLTWLVVRRLLWGPFFLLPRFLFNWFLWPPLSVLSSLVGLTYGSASSTGIAPQGTGLVKGTTRPPLIVQQSAKRGDQPRFPEGMQVNVPVGGGGHGARRGKDGEPVLKGRVSEGIGRMAEDSRKAAEGSQDDGKIRRADGTVLEERGDVPRNPKKKQFEADVEDAKYAEQKRREAEAEGSGKVKRDEL
ncbi:Protein transport protein sec20 [Extremus antarcticus]|uniref:Protein transport protein sec20 n=1 Tax=Extremus antarcticus TaxID=702011 RepID=A0AAJ0G9U2_9PEZI|nr:Protein transport protein sec20 [Extremus antarcticus]